MSTTEFINPAAEKAFEEFVQKYYEIEAARAAWTFFEGDWANQQTDVMNATADLPDGPVDTLLKAQALIGPTAYQIPSAQSTQTYWLWQYTNFKTIGLITGINPRGGDWGSDRYDLQLPMKALPAIKEAWSGRNKKEWLQDEVDERTRRQLVKTTPGTGESAVIRTDVSGLGQTAGTIAPSVDRKGYVFLLSPLMLTYLARKYVWLKSQGQPDDAQLYYNLWSALIGLLENMESTAPADRRLSTLRPAEDMAYARDTAPEALITPSGGIFNFLRAALTAADAESLADPSKLPAPWNQLADNGIVRSESMQGIRFPGSVFGIGRLRDFAQWGALTVYFGMTAGGDQDLDAIKNWMFDAISLGDSKGTGAGPALEAVDAAVTAFTAGMIGDWGPNYARIRRGKRLDMIRGFYGASGEPAGRGASRTVPALAEEAPDVLQKIEPVKRNLKPFDFQCYLLENIRHLTSVRGGTGPAASDYKHIIKLDTNQQPALVKNHLTHRFSYDQARALLNICPDVQATLVPYLKIWRVDYDKDNKPFREVPLQIPNFIDPNDGISSILKKGRLPGAGIKSFSWSLDGVQPAEVDNNISATLDMYFQSVSDFFNGQTQAGQSDKASFLDLVIASPSKKGSNAEEGQDPTKETPNPVCTEKTAQMKSQQYEGSSYRIKVTAGWAPRAQSSDQVPAALLSAIRKSRITLYLQQTRHDFQFNQDGSLVLSIDYQAALSGMTTSPSADILGQTGPDHQAKIESKQDEIDDLREKTQEADTEANRTAHKDALEELKKLRQQDRLLKYKRFLEKMFATDKVYHLAFDPTELSLPPYSELTPEGRAKRAKKRQSSAPHAESGQSTNNVLLEAVSAAAATGGTAEDAATTSNVAMQNQYKALEESGKMIFVSYFYLGDLLDTVLEQVRQNSGADTLPYSFFLSEVEMVDPLVALQIRDLENIIKCGQDLREAKFLKTLVDADPTTFSEEAGVYQLMNIGDIPISVDAFQVWFKDYVVKKDRDKYYFLHFVKDLAAELITKALSSKCFGEGVKFTQRFDVQPISYDASEGKDRLKPNATVRAGNPNLDSGAVYSLAKSVRAYNESTPAKDAGLGLVLLGTDSKPKGLYGENSYETDIAQGIYHNYLGASCGLVKTINFNRFDQPYLRESKIQKEGSFSAAQLRELYSAEIELYGNTLYRNGNYIYLNPAFVGAGDNLDLLNILGLHGYYLITGVNSVVTENSFKVSVSALHQAIAFPESKLMVSADVIKAGQKEWAGLSPEENPERSSPPADPAPPAPTAAPAPVEERAETEDVEVQSGGPTSAGRVEVTRGAPVGRTGLTAGTSVSGTGARRRD